MRTFVHYEYKYLNENNSHASPLMSTLFKDFRVQQCGPYGCTAKKSRKNLGNFERDCAQSSSCTVLCKYFFMNYFASVPKIFLTVQGWGAVDGPYHEISSSPPTIITSGPGSCYSPGHPSPGGPEINKTDR